MTFQDLKQLTFPILMICLFGVALTFQSARVYERFGPGLYGDSFRYLSVANHIADGRGIKVFHKHTGGRSVPMINFAPGYPSILAVGIMLGLEERQVTTYWNIICHLANLLIAGFLILLSCRRVFPALAGMALIGYDRNLIHFMHCALTESTFLALSLICCWAVWSAVKRNTLKSLLFCSLVIGISPLIRYVGIAFIPAGFLAFLILSNLNKEKRRIKALMLLVLSSMPLLIWLLWSWLFAGASYDKSMPNTDNVYHVISLSESVLHNLVLYPVRNGYTTESLAPFFVLTAGILLFATLTKCLSGNRPATRSASLFIVACVFLTGYLGTLTAAMIWRRLPNMTDEIRYLVPAYNMIWILLPLAFSNISDRLSGVLKRPLRGISAVCCFLILLHCYMQASVWIQLKSLEGIDGTRSGGWKAISGINWFPKQT